MKKISLILVGTLILTLVFFTGCVYIGLPAKKVKQHNEAIIKQLSEYPLDNFSGSFYYIPESEGTSISFSYVGEKREYLIRTDKALSYFDGTTEKIYTFSTKAEESSSGNTEKFQSINKDIQEILDVIRSYNGQYDKANGRSGIQKYEEEVYDEIEHDIYSMEWKYSSIAMFLFYVNAKTSALHSICLRDISKNMNEEKPHFNLYLYPNESFVSDLKEEYETQKNLA